MTTTIRTYAEDEISIFHTRVTWRRQHEAARDALGVLRAINAPPEMIIDLEEVCATLRSAAEAP